MRTIVVLSMTALALSQLACGNPCNEAIDKLKACSDTLSPPGPSIEIGLGTECEDGVSFMCGTGQQESVKFESWSEAYLACDPDPATCICDDIEPLCEAGPL